MASTIRPWPGLTQKDLVGIEEKIKDKFEWKHTPRPFQVEAVKAQLQRHDTLIHAGTGMGKTAIAAGAFADAKTKGMVTFMVSPLIALQTEQLTTFRDEYKLKAVAINSTGPNRLTANIMKEICQGRWQIVIISPEMLLSKRFIDGVLRNQDIIPRVLAVVVDEAHVVSHWGTNFHKMYGRLGILRALLPRNTPFVAMSATMPSRVRKDILTKLHMDETNLVNLNLGNDRTNVSLIVRPIHNPMNTYTDLEFVIPKGVERPTQIKKTFIYADRIEDGYAIQDYLMNCLPEDLHYTGVIRPYSVGYSVEHRRRVMALFKAGVVRVLICTDAAGMGCNIPDIDVVVQWKLPSTVSSFIQRAGRAARGEGHSGVAVLLAERSVFKSNLENIGQMGMVDEGKKTKKSVRQSSTYPKASNEYALTHGIRRGMYDGRHDNNKLAAEVPIDFNSIDEGLYSLVQATTCRRAVAKRIYGNQTSLPLTVPCCDICKPELLNDVRPAAPELGPSRRKAKVMNPVAMVRDELHKWRVMVWQRDHKFALWPPSLIMTDKMLDTVASAGPIERLKELEEVVGENWTWFGKYGDELLDKLHTLDIPLPIPKQKEVRVGSRQQDVVMEVGESDKQRGGSTIPTTVNSDTRAPTTTQPSVPSTSSFQCSPMQPYHIHPTAAPFSYHQAMVPGPSRYNPPVSYQSHPGYQQETSQPTPFPAPYHSLSHSATPTHFFGPTHSMPPMTPGPRLTYSGPSHTVGAPQPFYSPTPSHPHNTTPTPLHPTASWSSSERSSSFEFVPFDPEKRPQKRQRRGR